MSLEGRYAGARSVDRAAWRCGAAGAGRGAAATGGDCDVRGPSVDIRAAAGVADREGVVASIDSRIGKHEGYHLTIGDWRIGIVARDGAGLAYGFANADAARAAVRQAAAVPAHRRLARLSRARRDARHQPRQGPDDGDALSPSSICWRDEDQPAPALHRAHVRLSRTRQVWEDASPMTGEEILCARRVLPRAVHRARAEPEFVRPHGALAEEAARTRPRRKRRTAIDVALGPETRRRVHARSAESREPIA